MDNEVLTMRSCRVRQIMEHSKAVREAAAASRTWASLVRQGSDLPQVRSFTGVQDGAWKGRRCFIIAGGPSLRGFDYSRLQGERTIAINKAIREVPFADILFGMDYQFIEWIQKGDLGEDYRRAYSNFTGEKIWLNLTGAPYAYPPDVRVLLGAGEIGWTRRLADGLYHGNNSGYAAINLALVLGADPIILLGYDMKLGPNGASHYHKGYPTPMFPDALPTFKSSIEAGARELPAGAPQILNANKDSALRCFPFVSTSKILPRTKTPGTEPAWKVVSFYTTGTGYENEIKKLQASLDRLSIPYHFFPVEPRGSWRANLNYKSEIILQAFDMFPKKDIVFIDADAVVRRYPELFDKLSEDHQYDVAAHFHPYRGNEIPGGSLLSGTLWFQNSERGRELVRTWNEIGAENKTIRHQHCLRLAIEKLSGEGRYVFICRLPREYTLIFDYYRGEEVLAVVEHFQASRRLRAQVGTGEPLVDSNFTTIPKPEIKTKTSKGRKTKTERKNRK